MERLTDRCRQRPGSTAGAEMMLGMALRSPIFLDVETLLSQAEYNDVEVPRQAEIVARTVSKRSGGGKIGVFGVGNLDAALGTDVEYQSTYSLAPREKATVSKVIDSLIREGAVIVDPDENSVLARDSLLEIEGQARITAASLAGKMFFIFRRLMDTADGDLDTVLDLEIQDPRVVEQLKQVYLRNELIPIPILLELSGSKLPQKVYINVRPDHFIDVASANRVENEFRIFGSISRIIAGGDEGFASAEEWLLHDWEHLMRRKLMPHVGDVVKDMVEQLELELPASDVHEYIAGPAIIVDAIAIY
ncbi:hypothetical protein [Kineosporia sp. NBRC 101731]|uniref:DUF6414 family protein n=1 Tax=Kineosporia sp. NBRC 101731 TaxID=3032199 RepID=UPI0024A379B4|nr:hypothetical protein [Kineosporia sp. NBRC 101731]GLY33425.1 hypothetical protein Kisp02_67900 [Kineosporia sp. NBRC 101731]